MSISENDAQLRQQLRRVPARMMQTEQYNQHTLKVEELKAGLQGRHTLAELVEFSLKAGAKVDLKVMEPWVYFLVNLGGTRFSLKASHVPLRHLSGQQYFLCETTWKVLHG